MSTLNAEKKSHASLIVVFMLRTYKNKEVFVKHEKAPTAPRFQGVFTKFYMPMFRKTAVFGQFGQFRPFPVVESGKKNVKRHINRPSPFIWAYSQVSMTIRYKATAWKAHITWKTHISKTRWFRTFWPISAISGGRTWPKLSKGTSTADGRTDGRTDGHPDQIPLYYILKDKSSASSKVNNKSSKKIWHRISFRIDGVNPELTLKV